MDRAGFKVEGVNALVRDLLALGLDVDDLKDAFSTIAREGAQKAASYAPRKSGRLAGDVRGNRAKSKAMVFAGRKSVPYAGVQNFGWLRRGIAPTHFMQRADEAMRPRAVQLLEQEINRSIQKKGLR